MEIRSPNGTNFPPTPEGKARARRLWDEHEAKTKTGEKAERELTEEQLREHEKILREERETFELEREREREEQEREQRVREQWRNENIETEKREREREIKELRERERIRMIEADAMRQRELQMLENRERELLEAQKMLREERWEMRQVGLQESKEEEVFIREEELQEFKCALTGTGVDAVLELASLLNLDETLKNKLKGTVTVYEMFAAAVEKFPELMKEFEICAAGSSMNHAIEKFNAVFRALKKSRKQTRELVTVLALRALGPAYQTKVNSAVLASVSVVQDVRDAATMVMKQTGDGITFDQLLAGEPISRMPGIVELFSAESTERETIWSSICEYVVQKMTYCGEKGDKLKVAKATLAEFDGSKHRDYDIFIAEVEKLISVCASWYSGEFIDTFRFVELVVSKCPDAIRMIYDDYIADEELQEMDMSRQEFKNHLQKVWKRAVRKGLMDTSVQPKKGVPLTQHHSI